MNWLLYCAERRFGWELVYLGCLVLLLGHALPVSAQHACNRSEFDQSFSRQFRTINTHIRTRQSQLEKMIADPSASEEQIKTMTSELISWKAKRDQVAIEYILRQRREECLSPSFSTIPNK
ncbi:MAG: hypothetical protein KME03_12415 [Aphanocapsa lilacina HA4352-LM1]|jgi:septal ring factor EnvC (AmiA/AmiB activator)|nr:hypothetical protein [Aphanocapsa lilacina HA4352-LM1]